MKLRTSLAAAGAAVVLGTTGAFVLPAVASAHSTTHTLKFTAVQTATVGFTRATGGIQDTDVNAAARPSASTCCTSRPRRRAPSR